MIERRKEREGREIITLWSKWSFNICRKIP
jgi:hypothetical protein